MTKIERRGDKWTTVIDLPVDPITGNRRRKRITEDTKKATELAAAKAIQSASGGLIVDEKVTLKEFTESWFEATVSTVKPSTLRRYKDLSRLHIVPVLGSKKIAKLTPIDIHTLHNDRLAAGLSQTSVRHVHSLLHRMLSDAVRWGVLIRNVTDAVQAPKRSTPESLTWNPEQVDLFLKTAADEGDETLWVVALFTGMRRGELLGLKWADVDFTSPSISVRRSLSRGSDSRLVEGAPKTAKGRRRIALAPTIVESLRKHRLHQKEQRLKLGEMYENNDLVFANEFGRSLHPNTFTRRFQQLVRKAEVPYIRPHDLRHTNATMMLRQGTHMKIVQERLGHANVSMTMDLYSHVSPDLQNAAALNLENLIAGNREKVS